MKKKGLKFQVTVPIIIFRLLGVIYFVTSVLLSLFFFIRCGGIQTDLQMFCVCLFFIGVLFFFADHIWHVDFYKEYFEIHKLIFWKKVDACDVKKLFITDTHKIQIWNEKKKVASIDINCVNYKKVIQYFEKIGIEILEESEDEVDEYSA